MWVGKVPRKCQPGVTKKWALNAANEGPTRQDILFIYAKKDRNGHLVPTKPFYNWVQMLSGCLHQIPCRHTSPPHTELTPKGHCWKYYNETESLTISYGVIVVTSLRWLFIVWLYLFCKIVYVFSSASFWMITVWTFFLVKLKTLHLLATRNRIWIAKEAWQQLWSLGNWRSMITLTIR